MREKTCDELVKSGGGGGHKLKIEEFKIIIHYKPQFGRIY